MKTFTHHKLLQDVGIAALVGVFIGFLAPFGMDTLAWPVVYGFWLCVCVMGAVIYSVCIYLADQYLAKWLLAKPLRIALGSVLASLPLSVCLMYLRQLFFGVELLWQAQWLAMWLKVLPIGLAITTVVMVVRELKAQRAGLVQSQRYALDLEKRLDTDPYAALNQKLPVAVRGDILHIEAADHYLNITTVNGKHMLLMRLKDALALLVDAPGMQVHRSWWIAKAAVQSLEKQQRRTVILMQSGQQVPVSKTYLGELKTFLAAV